MMLLISKYLNELYFLLIAIPNYRLLFNQRLPIRRAPINSKPMTNKKINGQQLIKFVSGPQIILKHWIELRPGLN